HVPGDLVVSNLTAAIFAYPFLGQGRAGALPDPRHQLFAKARIWHANDVNILDVRMAEEKFLYLARGNVLSTPDHHVLDPADDLDVPVVIHRRQISGVQPAGPVDRGSGELGLVPVAEHHRITTSLKLADLSPRNCSPCVRLGESDLDMWMDASHRRGSAS